MNISAIVAVDKKFGIAKDGQIPWSIKEDLTHFRDITKRPKSALIMGRVTWESCKDKITDRLIIVVTTTLKGEYMTDTLEGALDLANRLELEHVFICGGQRLYGLIIAYNLDTIYLTVIDDDYGCDLHINLDTSKLKLSYTRTYQLEDTATNKLQSVTFNCYSNKSANLEELSYLNLLYKTLTRGTLKKGRNGNTLSLFGETLRFDLSTFPLLTTKKTFLRGAFCELMFFLRGQTDSKILEEQSVKIWSGNSSREFLDRQGLNYREGDIGGMYGHVWRHFGTDYVGCDAEYGGFDQIEYVIKLLKTDPFSRRILMTTYDPQHAHQGCLFPCHSISTIFNVQQGENCLLLNCLMTQRSADIVLGTPFNLCGSALLIEFFCKVVNDDEGYSGLPYKPGTLMITMSDVHIYESHITQALRQTLRDPYDFPKLKLSDRKITDLTNFKFEDLELINYNHYPGIIAKMVI